MKPPPFAYVAPDTLEEALALLAEHGDEARVIAGGQSLMPMLALRMARPGVLVDIGGIEELDTWQPEADSVVVGATVRQRRLLEEREFAAALPLCAEAAAHIGHPATRSRGTIVGSLCHADPAAELPVCASVLGAELTLRSTNGSRQVAMADFFDAALATTIGETELATALHVPAQGPRTGHAFLEVARRHGDFAIVAVACAAQVDEAGALQEATVSLGGVGDAPLTFRLSELAPGGGPEPARIADFAESVVGRLDPNADIHATAAYRRTLAETLTGRAVTRAVGRARDRN